MANQKKQAVVIVHGIGEQRPMDTVREFVKTVWAKDHELSNTRFWNKPSEVSNSLEQRRLTTDYAKILSSDKDETTSRVDFYEYYWAHHTVGTTLQHLKDWFATLLFRSPLDYPKPLLPFYIIIWAAILFTLGYWAFSGSNGVAEASQSPWQSLKHLLVPLVSAAVIGLLVNYLGDVARYVRANPSNIKVRQAIRQGGIELLQSLTESGDYDRIVLVGHSLGSVICYDILCQFWAFQNKFKNTQQQSLPLSAETISLIEKLEEIDPQTHQKLYRTTQNALFHQLQKDCELANASHPSAHQAWLISDLVTLGSPLTYADFLLFDDNQEFELRKRDREYPTSPPVKEAGHFYYQAADKSFLHHGAVFAPVRWTNIYSPHFALFGGDIISGPVNRAFQSPDTPPSEQNNGLITPILEIPVDAASPGWRGKWLTHTNYWTWHKSFEEPENTPAHILALRNALDLKGQQSRESN